MIQFEVPALVPADPNANVTDLLVERVKTTPNLALFAVPEGAGWRDITAAELFSGRAGRINIEVGDQYSGALLDEPARDGETQPSGSTGDDSRPVGEKSHRITFLLAADRVPCRRSYVMGSRRSGPVETVAAALLGVIHGFIGAFQRAVETAGADHADTDGNRSNGVHPDPLHQSTGQLLGLFGRRVRKQYGEFVTTDTGKYV